MMNLCPRILARSASPRAAAWSSVAAKPVRNCRVWQQTRGLKTDSPVDKKLLEKLPLAGIRVLDMTRVLAGVGDYLLGFKI